jgi:hypothetical protein
LRLTLAMDFEMHDDMGMHNMHMHHSNHDHASMMAMGDASQGGHLLLCSSSENMGGMVMYMEGFQWTLKGEGSCLNFFFASWKLDTYSKFFIAMVCVVSMGIATEGINRWKHNVAQSAKSRTTTRTDLCSRNSDNNNYAAMQHTCLQGLSILSAYLLMLVVMTYSLEFLSCVIVGLMIGHYVFDGDSLHRGGGTPCCTFLETTGGESDGNDTQEAGTSLTEALLSRTTLSDSDVSAPATTSNDTLVLGTSSNGHSCCSNEDGVGSQNEEEGII